MRGRAAFVYHESSVHTIGRMRAITVDRPTVDGTLLPAVVMGQIFVDNRDFCCAMLCMRGLYAVVRCSSLPLSVRHVREFSHNE